MISRRIAACLAAVLAVSLGAHASSAPQAQSVVERPSGAASITPDELKEWLSYIASDQLQGRRVYEEGLGLAAAYIADHLKEWGVKPAGDDGGYFQVVKVLGVNTTSNSSVTVTVNGQTKTFKDGEGVTFSKNQGGKQTITAPAEFVGTGLSLPDRNHDDYKGRDVRGKIVIYLGRGPEGVSTRLLAARGRNAIELQHAAAAIGPPFQFGRGRDAAATPPTTSASREEGASPSPAPSPAPAVARGGFGSQSLGDFQTVQRLDTKVPPQITATDEFFEFLLGTAGLNYAAIKGRTLAGEALPPIPLKGASITINVDADYTIVQTRLTRNVVGEIEGTDPSLTDSYVLFGAHYDHVGYLQTPPAQPSTSPAPAASTNSGQAPSTNSGQPTPAGPGQGRGGGFGGGAPGGCTGQTRDTPHPGDIINNGADDDGSGTVAVMAIAKAFATGPKPKRSVVFVWHAGEEAGLLGSRYMADYPEVPLDKVAAQLNIDMIGRNRCDRPSEGNTVYIVGSDRISTELHNLNEDANASLPSPLKMDYEMNDPADPESIYTRSDHYSYASKGIPIIFYTTGLHRDYHYLTDEVGKIEFPKMAHIAQLIYTTGWKVANLDHFPVRDNKGPRMGKGATGKIES
jgi:Peptidase family M28